MNYPIGVSLGEFTDEEVLQIREAMDRIQEEVGEQVFRLEDGAKWEHDRCGMVFLSKGDVPEATDPTEITLAYTWNRYAVTVPHGDKFICTSVVHLRPNIYIDFVQMSVRHELYHAIGLRHDAYPNSIMNTKPHADSTLIDMDREIVRNLLNGGNTTTCNL